MRVEPLEAFDGAGAGDHRQVAAADLHAGHVDDRRLGLGLVAGQLVGGQNRNDVGHAGDRPQRSGLQFRFVADHADDRAELAAAQMGLQAERFHAFDDMVDLGVAGSGLENDDHA